MAENKLSFVPIDLQTMRPLLQAVINDFQQKDREEMYCYIKDTQTPFDYIAESLERCDEKYFVVSNGDIIGIAAYQTIVYDSVKTACVCVLTTNLVKKHHRDYVRAAKMFIASVASSHDILIIETIEDYKSSLKMASKLGFKNFSTEQRKGKNFIVQVLKGASYGMD